MEIKLTLRNAAEEPPEDGEEVFVLVIGKATKHLYTAADTLGKAAKEWSTKSTVLYVPMSEVQKEISK